MHSRCIAEVLTVRIARAVKLRDPLFLSCAPRPYDIVRQMFGGGRLVQANQCGARRFHPGAHFAALALASLLEAELVESQLAYDERERESLRDQSHDDHHEGNDEHSIARRKWNTICHRYRN